MPSATVLPARERRWARDGEARVDGISSTVHPDGISFTVPVWGILDRWIGFCGYDSIYRNETAALLGQAEAHLL
jgi:hypothetical protein